MAKTKTTKRICDKCHSSHNVEYDEQTRKHLCERCIDNLPTHAVSDIRRVANSEYFFIKTGRSEDEYFEMLADMQDDRSAMNAQDDTDQ